MHKQRLLACSIAALLGMACGDGGGDGDNKPTDVAQQKQEARTALADGDTPVSNDPCSQNAWYADGECDAWCPRGDADDCNASSEPVVCALFFTEADGKCDRSDPCGPVQDADCQKPAGGGSNGGGAVECITIRFKTNGKCEAAVGCESSDPEDCGSDDLVCTEIWSPADGKCDTSDPCGPVNDEDCQQGSTPPGNPGGGVACIEIAFSANGKCEAAPGCEYTDPKDCPVDDDGLICPAIYREKDGKCPLNDPCDPDC